MGRNLAAYRALATLPSGAQALTTLAYPKKGDTIVPIAVLRRKHKRHGMNIQVIVGPMVES